MFQKSMLAVLFALLGNLADADAQVVRDPRRGELLYSTQCIFCHNAQLHWRDKKLASDWATLESEVRRWQENAGLGWSNEDIAAVARYLNTFYYHYPAPQRLSGFLDK